MVDYDDLPEWTTVNNRKDPFDEWMDEDKPECCVACGCGAWPDCEDSCSIFDD